LKKTILRDEAEKLVHVLWIIVHALDDFHTDDRREYTRRLAARLRPLVLSLEHAVLKERSRETAKDLMSDISPIMDEINAAATKGEIAIFKDDTLAKYWKLSAIFQESRFANDHL
jgi:hypothetical protein